MDTGITASWETQYHNANLDCFEDADFAGDLPDSKSTSGGVLCFFGSHTSVQLGGPVRNCSTESEVILLDAGLRLDGVLALDLWDVVIDVLDPQAQGNLMQHSKKKQHMSKNSGVRGSRFCFSECTQIQPTSEPDHETRFLESSMVC